MKPLKTSSQNKFFKHIILIIICINNVLSFGQKISCSESCNDNCGSRTVYCTCGETYCKAYCNCVKIGEQWVPSDICDCTGILPINISFLKLILTSNSIKILWRTISETNNDFFTIERSTDTKNYIGLACIKGAGNSNTVQSYSFIDKEIEKNTIYYYRLKQTDFDGAFKYYGPISIVTGREPFQILSVYPNPCSNHFVIKTKGYLSKKSIVVKLYNCFGMLVYEKTYSNLISSDIKVDLNNGIKKGLYMLQIHTKDKIFKEKIIVNL